LANKDPIKIAEEVANLWQFTKDMGYGIKELAANILQHAKDKKGESRPGIVCAQFIKKFLQKEKGNYKKELPELFRSYIDELVQTGVGVPDALLELHVLDMGEIGIRSTLLHSCKKNIDKLHAGNELHVIFLDDIESLEKGRTTLRDLVTHTEKGILGQQSKRSIAHLGLLIFNKLIHKNNGLIITSTYNLEGIREWVMEPNLNPTGAPGAGAGTRITFLLPVIPEKVYGTHVPHPISIPVEPSSLQAGIERPSTLFRSMTTGPTKRTVK
jgi:hypothetical protein